MCPSERQMNEFESHCLYMSLSFEIHFYSFFDRVINFYFEMWTNFHIFTRDCKRVHLFLMKTHNVQQTYIKVKGKVRLFSLIFTCFFHLFSTVALLNSIMANGKWLHNSYDCIHFASTLMEQKIRSSWKFESK